MRGSAPASADPGGSRRENATHSQQRPHAASAPTLGGTWHTRTITRTPTGRRTAPGSGSAIAIIGAFLVVQVVGGMLSGSLALLADAGHMASDLIGLVVALVAAMVAARPATDRQTYGYRRAEVLGALVNGVILIVVAVSVAVAAIGRLIDRRRGRGARGAGRADARRRRARPRRERRRAARAARRREGLDQPARRLPRGARRPHRLGARHHRGRRDRHHGLRRRPTRSRRS